MSTPIIIVEPNSVVRECLKHYLEHKGFTIAGAFERAQSVANLVDVPDETLIVLSGVRGDTLADFTMIKALRRKARIVVYGGRSELSATLEAIRSGATVYLDDKAHALMFLNALELAAHGFVTMSIATCGETAPLAKGNDAACGEATLLTSEEKTESSNALAHVAPSFANPDCLNSSLAPAFSPRETAILQLLREGAPNKLIARRLSLTEATVKVHLKSILRKIRVNNRTQAAIWAMGHETFHDGSGKRPFPTEANGRL